MCLEEMLACAIPEGALFYQQTRHRERVSFDESLRNRIVTMTGEMHDLFARGHTAEGLSGVLPARCLSTETGQDAFGETIH